MEPRFYIDLRPNHAQPMQSKTTLPLAVEWFQGVMRVLHGVFGGSVGEYAIALPEYLKGDFKRLGRVVRVFSQTRQHLIQLRENIEDHIWLRENVLFSAIREVPDSHAGPWVSYSRVRAPKRGVMPPEVFMKRLDDVKSLPSFMVVSGTNKQRFPVAIARARYHQLKEDAASTAPDSYGLGRQAAPLLLPDLIP